MLSTKQAHSKQFEETVLNIKKIVKKKFYQHVLTDKERKKLNRLLRHYRADELVQKMKLFKQHGRVSTYDHCESVTKLSYWLNHRLHLHADDKTLVHGAFLHDFYLYDWHDGDGTDELHGFYHAGKALKNAREHFKVNKKVAHVIESHMWPLNLTKVPRTREAAIVCAADKCVSLVETLAMREKKNKAVSEKAQ